MNFGITPCPLTQTKALTMNGVDISNPSKLSDGQWIMVCAQSESIPPSMHSMVRPCSSKLATLFDAAKSRCGTPNQNEKARQNDKLTELDKLGRQQLVKVQEAKCQAVSIMVRL